MHYWDNKEAIPYTAIESNDIMDFLANPNIYIQNYDLMYIHGAARIFEHFNYV